MIELNWDKMDQSHRSSILNRSGLEHYGLTSCEWHQLEPWQQEAIKVRVEKGGTCLLLNCVSQNETGLDLNVLREKFSR